MIKSWMVIGGVTLVVGILVQLFMTPRGIKWFKRLRRPNWLTFEAAIPIIWTTVFICGAWSATLAWETLAKNQAGRSQAWVFMGGYLLLELVTLAYSPVMMNLQSLKIGTLIGATGALLAALLAIAVWQVSHTAAWLLLPYLLWSPIGTYTTWAMARLNPQDA
ncbi:MAG: TspO/MBR family protein [Leptolyngbyaceae cyanobacterium CSU_1_4]|nr:TspO/MBR family protein [Leptolyngbyaceae cyanobacterium CSU_1_4]